ncbi:MAG: RNA-binding S4 domain-containing protein [Rhodocyclaceae bacterium]|nr:RNA-binding S4 domain-containing protein [Rhodocyclaceae bacterium]
MDRQFPRLNTMTDTRFTLSSEFIELNALLKVLGLASSGGAAKVMIGAGLVQVDDQVETRIRRKLRGGEVVRVGEEQVMMVRGSAA